jgi:hypothetical protein
MAIETYNNLSLQKQAPLDAKLSPVETSSLLPDPNMVENFLFEGATIYVKAETANYRVEKDPLNGVNLIWVKQVTSDLVTGVINILASTTVLDLNLVSPPLSQCDSVLINISGTGTTATIFTITNFPDTPDDLKMPFFVQVGKQVTFKHTDYTSANAGQIVLEDGFDMTISGRNVGNEQLILTKDSTALVQYGAVQFIKKSEWATNILSIATVDNLTSTSINLALSANQGRILDITKQDILSVTDRMTLDTITSVLDVKPYPWLRINLTGEYTGAWNGQLPAINANTPNFLASMDLGNENSIWRFNGPHIDVINNRYVDLRPARGLVINAPLDHGLWVLPAGLDSTVSANWLCVDASTATMQVTYDLATEDLGGSGVAGTDYYTIKIDKNSGVGLLKNDIVFDTLSSYPYSFKPTYRSANNTTLYEIEYSMLLSMSDRSATTLDHWQDIHAQLINTPDVFSATSQVNIMPSSAVIKDYTYRAYDLRQPISQISSKLPFKLTVKYRKFYSSNLSTTCLLKQLDGSFEGVRLESGTLTITKLA